ncbi:MAG TPA: hypothetical protein VN812_16530 [Candidatus Acidoferrales bacterium]|nr:hypothetical protein [Candidatus Acidoferrales bacterium]
MHAETGRSSPTSHGAWRISVYPDARELAFTLVHDADSAYSRRLAPLFEVFDRLGLKLTVTAFAFWADWAHEGAIWRKWSQSSDPEVRYLAPKAVPIVDPVEQEFYLGLAASGHEIGLHTPSETSDQRQRVIDAFEYNKRVFGDYPSVYVEHSRRSKKDAQGNEGSNPESIYYNTDILNHYKPWIWVDGPGALANEGGEGSLTIPSTGSPLSALALERYGITKGFVRTGRWRNAGGHGFLEWYTEHTIDDLEKQNGIALVYTHLDFDWLDLGTKRMHRPLEERLGYLASKHGWFVPASRILDRFVAVRELRLVCDEMSLRVTNPGRERMEGLTVVAPRGESLSVGDRILKPNRNRKIVVGTIGAGETLAFRIHTT